MKILRVAIFCFGAMLAALSYAQIQPGEQPSAIVFNSELKPDIRVIIDISGSMKKNDPNNLRQPALELLVQLFPEGSKAGVWTFGQWVNNLVPSKNVQQAWRTDALLQAKKINSSALYTNIPLALEKAVADINSLDPRYDVQLILLTDGVVDISKSPAENDLAREYLINDLLPKLRKAGVTIHTVALSKNADQELMERLALDTGGLAAVAETADDLTRIFLQAFEAAAPAEQLPLEGNAFLVDSSIDEFTALLFRKADSASVQLISPDGKRHTIDEKNANVSWFRQDNYDLITVKNPMGGGWSIDADLEPDSRVTIVSHLNLRVKPLDKSGFTDDTRELQALLAEEESTIIKPEFLRLVDMSVDIHRRDDDKSWHISLSDLDPIPQSGMFQSPLGMIDTAGVYDFTVNAVGKTFSRQRKQTIAVREPFGIRVTSTHDNPPRHTVSLFARNPEIASSKTTVNASVALADGSVQEMPVVKTAERRWKLTIDGGAQPQTYSVSFVLKGQLLDGQSFNKRTPPVQVAHLMEVSAPIAAALEEPVVAPEPTTAPAPEPAIDKPQTDPQPPESQAETVEADPVATAEPEASGDKGIDWMQIATYVALGLGNLLVIGLGYLAYKAVTGSAAKSEVLEDNDDIELDDDAIAADKNIKTPVLDDNKSEADSLVGILDDDGAPDQVNRDEELTLDESLPKDTDMLEMGDVGEVDELDLDIGDDDAEEVEKSPIVDIDDIDDFLDLPDDAIDIDPSKDKDN